MSVQQRLPRTWNLVSKQAGASAFDLLAAVVGDLVPQTGQANIARELKRFERTDSSGAPWAKRSLGHLTWSNDAKFQSISVSAVGATNPLGLPFPVGLLVIESRGENPLLQQASLESLHEQWAHARGGDNAKVISNLRRNGVLLTVIRGDAGQLPDLYLLAERTTGESVGAKEERPVGVVRILADRVAREAERGAISLDVAMDRALQPLANLASAAQQGVIGSDADAWRVAFGNFDRSRAYDRFRGALRDTLERTMSAIEACRARPATTEIELAELREAASIVAFRIFFLVSIESRGVLYADGFEPPFRLRGLIEEADRVTYSPFRLLQELSLNIRGEGRGAKDNPSRWQIAVHGASIFANRPNDHFSDGLRAWLDALDDQTTKIIADPRRCALWDQLVRDLGVLATGQVSLYQRQADAELDDVSLGGSAHVQRILGDVYEQILAMVPQVSATGSSRTIKLVTAKTAKANALKKATGGTLADTKRTKDERRNLGAHYTPESLVLEMVRAALEPAFAAAWTRAKRAPAQYEKELLGLRILDPAMGSAHFLTVAALEVAREIAWSRKHGEPRPPKHFEYIENPNAWGQIPDEERAEMDAVAAELLQRVVENCCHGVDIEPLAVELGKLALWQLTMVEQARRGRRGAAPSLTFLDANLRCGNSLYGADHATVAALCDDFELGAAEGDLFSQGSASLTSGVKLLREFEPLLSAEPATLRRQLEQKRALFSADLGSLPASLPVDDHELRSLVFEQLKAAKERFAWLWDLAFLRAWNRAANLRDEDLKDSLRIATADSWAGVVGTSSPTKTQLKVRAEVRARAHAQRVFHWDLEFYDVFTGPARGFDVIVANPPFLGSQGLRGSYGEQGVNFLRGRFTDGTPDLCGFFFLLFDRLLSSARGIAGSIAPNTIVQGRNRELVMVTLVAGRQPRFEIFRSCQSRAWPGEAAVHISTVHFRRPADQLRSVAARKVIPVFASSMEDVADDVLDNDDVESQVESSVEVIDSSTATHRLETKPLVGGRDCSFLDNGVETEMAKLPNQSGGFALQGMIPRGDFSRPREFLQKVPAAERSSVFAYINNRGVQQSVRPIAPRLVIDVFDVINDAGLKHKTAGEQERWLLKNRPFLLAEMRRTVFPERQKLPESESNAIHREFWWRFHSPAEELREAVRSKSRVIVAGRTGKHMRPVRIETRDSEGVQYCFNEKLYVFPTESLAVLGLLNSVVFEVVSRRLSSTLGVGGNFAPSTIFPYFPMPWAEGSNRSPGASPLLFPGQAIERRLGLAAQKLENLRRDILLFPQNFGLHQEPFRGPTALYNAFDNQDDQRPAILELRAAHRALEAAVLHEYGWGDLAGEDRWAFERPWIDGSERYVPDLETRREYLARLAELNHKQAAAAKGTGGKKKATAPTLPAADEDPEPKAKAQPKLVAKAAAKPAVKALTPSPAKAKPAPKAAAPAPKSAAKPAVVSVAVKQGGMSHNQAVHAMKRAVDRSSVPLGRAAILSTAGVDEHWWAVARAAFEESTAFVMLGEKRGAKYTTRRAIQNALAKVVRKAGKAGVSKSEAIERLAELDFLIGDAEWINAIKTLIDLGKAYRDGQGKGTRYYA
jgi:hypothetical protein